MPYISGFSQNIRLAPVPEYNAVFINWLLQYLKDDTVVESFLQKLADIPLAVII